MKTSPENEIKKIYQKSVRLLNDNQARLINMQQVLKKAVIRLSLASRSSNEQINDVLSDINISVADNIDINSLSRHLDNLFLLINHADFGADKSEKTALYAYLKEYIEDNKNLPLSDEVVLQVKTLVAEKLPDAELSAKLLKSLSEIDKDFSNSKQQYSDSINLFIKDICASTGFTFDVTDMEISEIMHDLAIDLAKYIYSEKNNKSSVNDTGENSDISHILNEIVNQLALPASAKDDKFCVVKALNSSGEKNWKEIVDTLVQLVNQSISSIQLEKQVLEEYLVKISAQLSEIESFMHARYRDTDKAASLSLVLTDSVEAGVSSIEKTITKSTDLTALKHDVATTLKNIRKHVVDYRQAEKIKNEISLQTYSKMINELSHSQKESVELQVKLHVSKVQLLRDPLTGIANRLAYDERINIEFSRWKRTNAPLCIAIWDIDYFKEINDKYGHAVGDRVLKLFAGILNKRIRKSDLFARIGGEEFVLIMPDTSLKKAMTLNNKLRLMLKECNFHYDGQECQVTSSVGIAEFRRGDDANIVLDKADQALYQSKNEGRNRCTVFADV